MSIDLEKKGMSKNDYLKAMEPPFNTWTDLEGAKLDTAWDDFIKSEPFRLLREERNSKLSETDWWASSDLTMTQEQKDYRKALRDLPSTASPELDEDGKLTGVTSPENPKEGE